VTEINGRLTERRLSELERDVGRLEERTEAIPVLSAKSEQQTTEIKSLRDEIKDLRTEIGKLRSTLITFSLGITSSAVAVLIGILVVSNQ
jgi:hypothetical protein